MSPWTAGCWVLCTGKKGRYSPGLVGVPGLEVLYYEMVYPVTLSIHPVLQCMGIVNHFTAAMRVTRLPIHGISSFQL